MHQVKITEPAENDIRSTFEWWRDNRSVEQAGRWYVGIYRAIISLRQMPGRCVFAPETDLLAGDIRQLSFGIGRRPTHRIVFTISEEVVTVLRVRHSSQDILKNEDVGLL